MGGTKLRYPGIILVILVSIAVLGICLVDGGGDTRYSIKIDNIRFENNVIIRSQENSVWLINSPNPVLMKISIELSGMVDVNAHTYDSSLPNQTKTVGNAYMVKNGMIVSLSGNDLENMPVYLTAGKNDITVFYVNYHGGYKIAWDRIEVYVNQDPADQSLMQVAFDKEPTTENVSALGVAKYTASGLTLNQNLMVQSTNFTAKSRQTITMQNLQGVNGLLTRTGPLIPSINLVIDSCGIKIIDSSQTIEMCTGQIMIIEVTLLGFWHMDVKLPNSNLSNGMADYQGVIAEEVQIDSSFEFVVNINNLTLYQLYSQTSSPNGKNRAEVIQKYMLPAAMVVVMTGVIAIINNKRNQEGNA